MSYNGAPPSGSGQDLPAGAVNRCPSGPAPRPTQVRGPPGQCSARLVGAQSLGGPPRPTPIPTAPARSARRPPPPGPRQPHLEQVQRVRAAGGPARGQPPEVPARHARLGRHGSRRGRPGAPAAGPGSRRPDPGSGPGPDRTPTPVRDPGPRSRPLRVQSTVRHPRAAQPMRPRGPGGGTTSGGGATATPPRAGGRAPRLKEAALRLASGKGSSEPPPRVQQAAGEGRGTGAAARTPGSLLSGLLHSPRGPGVLPPPCSSSPRATLTPRAGLRRSRLRSGLCARPVPATPGARPPANTPPQPRP